MSEITHCPKCENAIPAKALICDHCDYILNPDPEIRSVGLEMTRYRFLNEKQVAIEPATRNVLISALIAFVGLSLIAILTF